MILKGKGACCLGNSIYQRNGSAPGLTVKDGMLLNNRPDSMTGIQQAAMTRKAMKRAEKASVYAEGVSMANAMDKRFGF